MARRSPIRVEIVGMERLRARLDDLTVELKAAARRALEESAEAVRAEAARTVRVDTGNLQRSVKARLENNRLRAEVGWWDADDLYASLHEHGTRRIPANPALGASLEQERARIAARIREQVRRSMR
ncbi:HK97-gp10 family putative phage morphogenesis protein [Streptomyces bacillaris]|uniref:HK97-gp10 family putative phage morphogenesis protein n=1 Tax=Streptomyces bacillaris TaxID=68179 RepID=UPI003D70302C